MGQGDARKAMRVSGHAAGDERGEDGRGVVSILFLPG